MELCRQASPITHAGRSAAPILILHGTADGTVPFENRHALGKPAAVGGTIWLSTEECALYWARSNGCSAAPDRSTSATGRTVTETFSAGDARSDVVLYSIVDGKHTWPNNVPWAEGRSPTAEISATDAIWEFFRTHPRK